MLTENHDEYPENFRLLLQQELVSRCGRNPKYSLRAFAKSLGIGPAALSDMLNGKRRITSRSVERLGLALGLPLAKIENFKAGTSPLGARADSVATAEYRQIALDSFAIISDWYHYAILELMKVKSFEPNAAWIAKRLGITRSEANIAIERLERAGLLEFGADGKWRDRSRGFSTNIIASSLTSAGSKKLQRQILAQSIRALAEISPRLRNHTSMTMAIDPRHLPAAIEKVTEFRRGLCEFLEAQGRPKEVYQFSISLFPITSIASTQGDTP